MPKIKTPRPLTSKQLDLLISAEYSEIFNRVQVNMMDLPKIYGDVHAAITAAGPATDPNVVKTTIRAALEIALPIYRKD